MEMYGREPPSILDYIPMIAITEGVDKFLLDRQKLLQELIAHLTKAQAKMKKVVDGHRRDLQFNIGDRVLLKLQPYRQHSVANRASSKLSAR